MTEIVWQDPPPMPGARGQYPAIAAALRARPGEWALVRSDVSEAIAWQIRRGVIQAFLPPGTFEARSVITEGRKADIYARYVGGEA